MKRLKLIIYLILNTRVIDCDQPMLRPLHFYSLIWVHQGVGPGVSVQLWQLEAVRTPKNPKKEEKKLWSRTSTALKNTRSPFSLSLSSHFQAFMVSGEYVVAKEEREESVCEWVKEREKWLQDSLGTTNESSGTIPYTNFLYLVSFCTYTAPLDANVNTVNKVLSNMYKMVVN